MTRWGTPLARLRPAISMALVSGTPAEIIAASCSKRAARRLSCAGVTMACALNNSLDERTQEILQLRLAAGNANLLPGHLAVFEDHESWDAPHVEFGGQVLVLRDVHLADLDLALK